MEVFNELKLERYKNTRNDGQLPSNRVFSTDEFGNVNLFSIAIAPAPHLQQVVPSTALPNETLNIEIFGSFFTPYMTVALAGQTVNYFTFINSNHISVNITTGAAENQFALTLNNGLESVFQNTILIVLGTVYIPQKADWILTEPVNVYDSQVLTENYGVIGSATWNKVIDYTKNFRIQFKVKRTPSGAIPITNVGHIPTFELIKVSNGNFAFGMKTIFQDASYHKFITIDEDIFFYFTNNSTEIAAFWDNPYVNTFEYRKIGTNIYVYFNGSPKGIISQTLTENVMMRFSAQYSDIFDIKYIETA